MSADAGAGTNASMLATRASAKRQTFNCIPFRKLYPEVLVASIISPLSRSVNGCRERTWDFFTRPGQGNLGRMSCTIIVISGMIDAPGQSEQVRAVEGMLHVDPGRGGEVAHGVAGAAPVAGVGARAVDDPRLVQAALVRAQGEVDRPRLVYLVGLDLQAEDVRAEVRPLIIAEAVPVA